MARKNRNNERKKVIVIGPIVLTVDEDDQQYASDHYKVQGLAGLPLWPR